MIYVTGDKHGQLESFEGSAYKKLKRGDTLIICGDFGFIWDGSAEEQRKLKWLQKRKYQIAFLDGYYENLSRLLEYPEEEYCSGKVRRIAPNIVWLQPGELYEMEGKKVLVFGGGSIAPRLMDIQIDAVQREINPNDPEVEHLVKNLNRCGGKVDVILTHEPPLSIKNCLEDDRDDYAAIHDLLEQVRKNATFGCWYFGKLHLDRKIPPAYCAVFNDVVVLSGD